MLKIWCYDLFPQNWENKCCKHAEMLKIWRYDLFPENGENKCFDCGCIKTTNRWQRFVISFLLSEKCVIYKFKPKKR